MKTVWKAIKIGGWAPLLVLGIHLFLSQVVHAYAIWPPTDIPVHFCGGIAIAFFVSRAFQLLPRETTQRGRAAILEILLIISLTATTAVFWEFAEFIRDHLWGSNIQVSLVNTMQDLAVGISGAIAVAIVRGWQLRLRARDLREIVGDWTRGRTG